MNAHFRLSNTLCWHVFLLSFTLVLLQLFQSELLFQRNAIHAGEIWRVLTGNFVHTNYYHLLMNLVGVIFICLLYKDYLSLKVFYISLLITTLAVGLGILFFSQQLIWYVGLSGALYGLYMIAASLALKHKDYLASLPILVGIPVKLLWDSQHPGLTRHSETLIGVPVATDAHLYGMVAGVLVSFCLAYLYRVRKYKVT